MSDGVKVFYSYAHEDEKLRDELEKYLMILKRTGVIDSWHDRKINAGSDWKNSIETYLDSADIILLLISADFINSDFCYEKEVRQAMDRHEREYAVVVPVILRPVNWKKAPFGKLEALPTDGVPVITWPDGMDAAFTNVSEGIETLVNDILKKRKSPLPVTKPPVYLAETTNEKRMQEYRDGIATELEAHGYRVIPAPDVDLADESPQYQEQIRSLLESAAFSVHPIGNKYGRTIVGASDKSVVELQNGIAEELRKEGRLESLIWIPPEAEPQGGRQIAFQKYLETDQQAQFNAELSRRPIESVKDRILEKLKKYDSVIPPPENARKSVYLMCEQRDKELLAEVKDFIYQNGFEVFLPPSVTDQGPGATFHDKCLTSCDATLIYYGEPNQDWLTFMIFDVFNAPKRRPSGEFLCKALFLAGSGDYKTRTAEILKYDGKSVATSLKPFIECLQRKNSNGGHWQ